jgi:flagellar L-ring protein precursor FlgH
MGRLGALALVGLAAVAGGAGCARRRPPLPPRPPFDVAGRLERPPANGSLWRPDLASNFPFLDVRARFPGDLLTVVVAERSEGKKDATTDTKAESSIAASVEDFFGIPASSVKVLPKGFNPESIVKAKTARESKGEGETSRTGNLTASITVTVTEIDPSGNLRVQGDKIITVNREEQHIVLTGTVRPEDVGADNSVLSTRLADARIDYYGRGMVGDKQGVPLVHRLYDLVWPF